MSKSFFKPESPSQLTKHSASIIVAARFSVLAHARLSFSTTTVLKFSYLTPVLKPKKPVKLMSLFELLWVHSGCMISDCLYRMNFHLLSRETWSSSRNRPLLRASGLLELATAKTTGRGKAPGSELGSPRLTNKAGPIQAVVELATRPLIFSCRQLSSGIQAWTVSSPLFEISVTTLDSMSCIRRGDSCSHFCKQAMAKLDPRPGALGALSSLGEKLLRYYT